MPVVNRPLMGACQEFAKKNCYAHCLESTRKIKFVKRQYLL